jgi:hypothetical protein
MGKMHELLAVEKDIVGRANAIVAETIGTFKNKAAEFYTGRIKSYKPFDEADKDVLPTESKELVDSVPAKLKYTFGKVAEEYDWLLQKEQTNKTATADLVIDGIVLGRNLPATFLLALESRLEKIRALILESPTLPNGLKWVPAPNMGNDVFTLEAPLTTYRTRKTPYPLVLAEATKEHKAQVVEKERMDTVGAYTEQLFDARVTSHYKSDLLERVDKVLVEVRKSVRRANQVEIVEAEIGKGLFAFILNGK